MLPGSFYVRAFIKTYAETVGLNADELLEGHKKDVPAETAEATMEPVIQKRSSRPAERSKPLDVSCLNVDFPYSDYRSFVCVHDLQQSAMIRIRKDWMILKLQIVSNRLTTSQINRLITASGDSAYNGFGIRKTLAKVMRWKRRR